MRCGVAAYGRRACGRRLPVSARAWRTGDSAPCSAHGQRGLAATEPVADDDAGGHRLRDIPGCERLHRGRRIRGGGDRLNFYVLGRRMRGSERMLGAMLVFAYWLAGVVVIAYSQPGGSVGAVLGAWALVGGLPFAVGRTLETRRALRRARGEHGAAGGRPRKPGWVAPRPRSETGWLASCTT